MKQDDFKKILFAKLNEAIDLFERRKGFILSVGTDLIPTDGEGLAVHMDGEVKQLVNNAPYFLTYLATLSNSNRIVFLDLLPKLNADGTLEVFNYDSVTNQEVSSIMTKKDFLITYGQKFGAQLLDGK